MPSSTPIVYKRQIAKKNILIVQIVLFPNKFSTQCVDLCLILKPFHIFPYKNKECTYHISRSIHFPSSFICLCWKTGAKIIKQQGTRYMTIAAESLSFGSFSLFLAAFLTCIKPFNVYKLARLGFKIYIRAHKARYHE